MGVTHYPNGVNVGDSSGGSADFQLGGTTVTASAAELNAISGGGLSSTELGYLDGAIAGTAVANKAIVVKANKVIDTIDITTPIINGTTVTATAAQINKLLQGTAIGFKAHAGTIVFTDSGTVGAGLSTFVGWSAVLVGAPDLAAGGVTQVSAGTVAGGSITVTGYQYSGSATASAVGTAAWMAFGT